MGKDEKHVEQPGQKVDVLQEPRPSDSSAPDVQPAEKQGSGSGTGKRGRSRKKSGPLPNFVRRFRMEMMMSKAELARRAGVSPLTLDRVERGMNCRMDTKRKILEALGLKPSDRKLVFPEDD
ncbi:MAG: helix-turn-helix transcriptional regulator [Deltaproteobacteria bacterium]|nr:helix-turn-helix transcriptional regulator [Deltaproteobacteria bacterium]